MSQSDPSVPVVKPASSPDDTESFVPSPLTLKFWGVRGDIPTPGEQTIRYGGNTSCVTLETSKNLLIFDAGTGVRVLGKYLLSRMPVEAHLFLSHCQWDRIQGFPFFVPAFIPINRFYVYGSSAVNGDSMGQRLKEQMQPPNFPVPIDIMGSELNFRDIDPGEVLKLESMDIHTYCLNPINQTLGYRVHTQNHSVVYATDIEANTDELDPHLINLAKEADVLIYDTHTWTIDEQGAKGNPQPKDWNWKSGIEVAKKAGVKQLVMFHHDPGYTDDSLDRIERQIQAVFPQGKLAREGMEIAID
ncbi:MBL fold metallo-hydrolase [Roseofilum sp. BLCC_M91]|uniref:MBL fold metallo-hydrolase n=1 Tax=Roseofilum halophilum BLCC-M91 TaxID=3022259 RepID=A0ABT7BJT5_9CYAN|nr:MBL fold metallo-hydrolase [Roseofilum halophilum]MDJ1179443.1 MBL fold metallo-hydrolase [Roseofilum halophilum BLCC-M91]